MNAFNRMIKNLVLIAILVFSISTIYGQVNKTVGTRITDVTTEKELKTNAILDLESTTKGFFLPRMTTLQRDAIKKEMGKDNGLAVYNIDNDCVEYWSERASKWMSLCGSLPPAKLDLDENSCDNIQFTGFTMVGDKPQLQQGTPLDPNKQWMMVTLKVNQVGTYTMSVTSNNGYFFSGEGQFQAIGTYQIVLKGMGTPIKGYEPTAAVKGDKLKFNLNGVDSKVCVDTEILVIPADLDFKITGSAYKANGTYNVGDPATLKKGNNIELDLKVVSGGLVTITAENTVVGMKFSGAKRLEAGNTKFILEPVLGENIPIENKVGSYDLTFGVNTKNPTTTIGSATASISIETTRIKGMFSEVTLGKEPYYQEGDITEGHKIELPIQVINSGKTNLYLKSAGGDIEFKAEQVTLVMPENEGETQNVTFKGVNGVLPKASSVALSLSGDTPRFEVQGGAILNLPLDKKPIAYTIDCKSVTTSRAAMPFDKPVGEDFYIKAQVNVTVPGEYEINTSAPVDGVLFSTTRKGVKQSFTKTGIQEVILYAVDGTVSPKNKGEYTVNLVTTDGSSASCTGVKVKVGYIDLKVLVYRSEYVTKSYEELFFTGKNKSGNYRFGERGEFVETGEVEVTTYNTYKSNTDADRKKVAQDIRNKKYNFIVFVGRHTMQAIDQQVADALFDYTRNNDGILLLATNHYHANYKEMKMYFEDILGERTSSVQVGRYTFRAGIELMKKFNGNQDIQANNIPADKAYNMTVHNMSDPLTSEKNNYKYNKSTKGGYKNISYYYMPTTGALTSINSQEGKFRPIVTDRGKLDRGMVFVHNQYSNLVWGAVASEWFEGFFAEAQVDSKTGEPFFQDYNGDYSVETDTAVFSTNLFIALVKQLVNK